MAASSTVDPHVWKACAGTSAQILTVGSRVYYFPHGHAEHSYSPPDFSSIQYKSPSFVHCRIVSVEFRADVNTDEVYTKLTLKPELSPPDISAAICSSVFPDPSTYGGDPPVVSFTKILTSSDANNGGGFSVPRFCADSIFPPLNYNEDPPFQPITVRDVHGGTYNFRHIYRGTPRRHLLTSGWSTFVNLKKLVAGDSVVFIKNRSKELFVGLRRALRSGGPVDCGRWAGVKTEEESIGLSRSGRGKLSPESVLEAARLAGSGRVFEVIYYPRAGSPNFVVAADAVEDAMSMYWAAGMKVKMAVETEDSSRMTWFQGTVTSITGQELGMWQSSPWRMLQVTWDEPEVLQNVKKVSPWQVELTSAMPQIHTPFPSSKKMKYSQGSEILIDGEDPMYFTGMGLTSNQPLFHYKTFPAGMQGARHDPLCVSSLTNFLPNNHSICFDDLHGNGMTPKSSGVSTELSIGSFLQFENLSPKSQGNTHFIGTELSRNQSCKPTKKDNGNSMKLFGQTIKPVEDGFDNNRSARDDETQGRKVTEGVGGPLGPSLPYPYKQLFGQTILTKKPVEDGFDNNGSACDDETQGWKVTEGVGGPLGSSLPFPYKQLFGQTILTNIPVEDGFDNNGSACDDEIKGRKVNEGVGGPLGTLLPYPYKQLCNRLDVQCQRVSAVGACSL
ncbi:auxin response factor 17-like [Magnolia sinica]|uniref:auxin response factor 17-like n=1 Tax=Magnolia sinica TaxID=86752 RepID=UPI0026590845|nr:auxin response factor 17-like [Magnolia sinica]